MLPRLARTWPMLFAHQGHPSAKVLYSTFNPPILAKNPPKKSLKNIINENQSVKVTHPPKNKKKLNLKQLEQIFQEPQNKTQRITDLKQLEKVFKQPENFVHPALDKNKDTEFQVEIGEDDPLTLLKGSQLNLQDWQGPIPSKPSRIPRNPNYMWERPYWKWYSEPVFEHPWKNLGFYGSAIFLSCGAILYFWWKVDKADCETRTILQDSEMIINIRRGI